MKQDVLSFKLKDGLSHRYGDFIISDLKSEDREISCANIDLYLEGKPYEEDRYSWAGTQIRTENIFESVLNAYLRGDNSSIETFCPGWAELFKSYLDLKTKHKPIVLPVMQDGEITLYELELETENFKFYQHNASGNVLMLRADNSICTTVEAFYCSALDEELKDIASGKVSCSYIGLLTRFYAKDELGLEIKEVKE